MSQRACRRCMNTTADGFATSRLDNKTPLCTGCAQDEAMEDFLGEILPMDQWAYAHMLAHFGLTEEEA